MPQRRPIQAANNEDRINAAILALKRNEIKSVNKAAAVYGVSESTLRRRRDGKPSRRDCHPNSAKLMKQEEEIITKYILELASRGFLPTLAIVRDMANALLAERGADEVGIKWPSNFVQRTTALQTKFTRKYDYKRAKCEDRQVIIDWFDLVRLTREAHGIPDGRWRD
jgi:hypothetical protein